MTREELDVMWNRALQDSVAQGEMFTRYRFAEMVAAAEREACAKFCDPIPGFPYELAVRDFAAKVAAGIRRRGNA